LRMSLGNATFANIARKFPNRSHDAVRMRIKTLGLTLRTSYETANQVARELGFSFKQLKEAKDALGQNWMRFNGSKHVKGACYSITETQREKLQEWLLKRPLNDKTGVCRGCEERRPLRSKHYCHECWPARCEKPSEVAL